MNVNSAKINESASQKGVYDLKTNSLETAFDRCGGLAAVKLLVKQLKFEVPTSTMNGWLSLNHIPFKWVKLIERLIEEYPTVKGLSGLRDFYGEERGKPGKKKAEEYPNPELHRAIARIYRSVTEFVNRLNMVMPGGTRVHRRHVYEWLNNGRIPAGPARFAIIHRKLLPEEVIGTLPDGETEWKPAPLKQKTPAEQVLHAIKLGNTLKTIATFGGVYTREAFLEAGFSEEETDKAFEAAFGIE